MTRDDEYRGILDELAQQQAAERDTTADQGDNEKRGREPMTDEEIAAIRARAEAATPGPWETDDVESWYVYKVERGSGVATEVAEFLSRMLRQSDAAFVAHARQDVPDLLAEIERLRGLLQREHDARLEICREAETLLRERDAAEATITELRHVGREQGDMMARLTGGTIERLERENAALRAALRDVLGDVLRNGPENLMSYEHLPGQNFYGCVVSGASLNKARALLARKGEEGGV